MSNFLARLDLRLLLMLALTDAAYIGMHVIHKFTGHFSRLSAITFDRSYGEYFQYAKEFWLVLLLLLAALQRFRAVYVAWALVCLYFIIDDCFMFRERLGQWLVEPLGLQPLLGLRGRDLGELLIAGAAAVVLVPVVILAHRRADAIGRRFSTTFLLLVIVLAGFGVFFDMLHQMMGGGELTDKLAGTFEDGGEMLVMSVIVAFVFRHDPGEASAEPVHLAS